MPTQQRNRATDRTRTKLKFDVNPTSKRQIQDDPDTEIVQKNSPGTKNLKFKVNLKGRAQIQDDPDREIKQITQLRYQRNRSKSIAEPRHLALHHQIPKV